MSLDEYDDMKTCADSIGITVPELLRRGYAVLKWQQILHESVTL